MKKLPLHIKIILGLILGILYAFLSSYLGMNEFTIRWIDPFGKIFMRLLKFIAVPLVLFSIVNGISGLKDLSKLGNMGLKTIGFYLSTTVISVCIGLFLVNVIQPGTHIDEQQRIKNRISYELWANQTPGVDIKGTEIYSNNPKYAHFMNEVNLESENANEKVKKMAHVAQRKKETSPLQFLVEMVPENLVFSISNNGLMLQTIFFALFFGIAIVMLGEPARPIVEFVGSVNLVFLKMVEKVMDVAPYFVFALLAGVIAKMADTPKEVLEIFIGLGSYSITLFTGLSFMVLIFYPLLARFFIKRLSYKKFFKKFSPAQLMAFSTSSSAATLPVTLECVEKNMGVSKNISSFVLPIGATINMDGTSLMQAVAVIFMAQLHLVDLTFSEQFAIVITAVLASIGTAAVPSAGLVMLIIVLQSVGLNPAWIAIIFPVDRILDMCRTVVNVSGDMTVATLIANSEKEELTLD